MNNVFFEYIDVFMVAYFDDIVVYDDTLKDHVKHLGKGLLKLIEHRFYLKPEKCSFAQ